MARRKKDDTASPGLILAVVAVIIGAGAALWWYLREPEEGEGSEVGSLGFRGLQARVQRGEVGTVGATAFLEVASRARDEELAERRSENTARVTQARQDGGRAVSTAAFLSTITLDPMDP